MFNHLEKLQQKPEPVKKRILAVSVAVLMVLIVVLWLNDVKYRATSENKEETPGPFSVFKEAVSNSVETLKAEIK